MSHFQTLLPLDRHGTNTNSLRSSDIAAADIGKRTQTREQSTTLVFRFESPMTTGLSLARRFLDRALYAMMHAIQARVRAGRYGYLELFGRTRPQENGFLLCSMAAPKLSQAISRLSR